MTKLSEAQRRVLEAMRDGKIWTQSVTPVYLDPTTKLFQLINTHEFLSGFGYLEVLSQRYENGVRYVGYRITPTGRAALQQSGVGDE